MIKIIGWYKHRPTDKSTYEVEMGVGWTQPKLGQYRLTLTALSVGEKRESLRLEVPYKDAQRIIEQWQEYMSKYPEGAEGERT